MCIKTLKFALKRFCLRTLKGDIIIIISNILEVPLYLADNTGKVSTCISAAYSVSSQLSAVLNYQQCSMREYAYIKP